MSTTPIDNFLLSLAVAIAGNASLAGPAAPAAGRAMWVNDADEVAATASGGGVYSVLRQYGGTSLDTFAGSRILSSSIQIDTRGRSQRAVREQAWGIYESLLEDDGRPRMHWAIPGKVVDAGTGQVVDDAAGSWEVREVDFTGGVPGVTGRDEQGRYLAPFSFDVEFDRIEI